MAAGRSVSISLITGTTRRASSSGGIGSEPGRVDSPPTSIIRAPSSSMAVAWATATSGSRKSPPSEKESGVTLRTPIRTGSGPRVRSPTPMVLLDSKEELRIKQEKTRNTRNSSFSCVAHLLLVAVGVRTSTFEVHLVDGVLLDQALQVLGVHGLVLDQLLGELVQEGAVPDQEVLGGVVGLVHDAPYLLVDLEGDLIGVVRLGVEVASHEDLLLLLAEGKRPELLAHPEACDHLASGLGHPLQVVGGACGDLIEDHPLGRTSPEHHPELRHELAPAHHEPILGGQAHRYTQGLASRDDGDLVHGVGLGQESPHYGVSGLVVGGDLLLLLGDQARLALGTGDDPVHGLLHLGHVYLVLVVPRGQERRLVDQVGQVRAGEARGSPGERLYGHVGTQGLASGVDLEDLLPSREVGTVHHDLPVETPWPQQCRVEDVGPIGRGEHDDTALGVEAVHLYEELVEGLLPLVVTAAKTRAALSTYGVYLVHEDDAGAILFGLLEEVPDPAGADTDEHLDEVRTRDREERHPGFAGHGARQERLAGSRRPYQKGPFGDTSTELLELLRGLEELFDLRELLDGLVGACYV